MKEKQAFIESCPQQKVPFELLTPMQRNVLQHTADGFTLKETAKDLGRSIKTIGQHRGAISLIGWIDAIESASKIITSALIQDGINNGYLDHKIGDEEHPVALTARETKIMDGVSYGLSNEQLAIASYCHISTLENCLETIYLKLGLLERPNRYHAIARYAYLKKHGCYPYSENEKGISADY